MCRGLASWALVADKETDGKTGINSSPVPASIHEDFVLNRYLVLGHSKFANLGPEYSWLVHSDLGYFANDNASQVVIDEPIILVYVVRQLCLKQYPWDHDESLFSHKLIYNPHQPAFASAREHAVLLLSRIFATPRGPVEAFIFPGEETPEWAHRYSNIVELRPVLPLATDGTSYAATLSWLRHEHETAFCLLPDPTAFIFGFDGDYLWVITADTSEALSLLASLPNPCKALGDLPILEVAMPIPDPNAPNRLERLYHRRHESPYGSPRSPRPTKYRTVTVNPTLVQFTEAVLEEATLTEQEDEESWILSRMVANVVGETSISPDRHGRRRKVVSSLSQSDVAGLEDSPSNPSSVASSQHGTQLKVRDASHVLSGNTSKRKRSEASMESDPTSDEFRPACKRSRIDSRSPTP
ncbi:hypothetical protein EV121DRAFT_271442 [Schizophyllum commune]